MVHRFEPRSAPRVFLLPAIAFVIVGGSVALIVVGLYLPGLIALAVSVWISYHLIRYAAYQFKSYVETSDNGLVCLTSDGVNSQMAWADVTHAGTYTTERSARYLFVYNEADDALLTIPPHYAALDQLEATIDTSVGNRLTLEGKDSDGLADALRPHLKDAE